MPDQILEDDAMIEDAVFVLTPDQPAAQAFTDAPAAVARLEQLYEQAVEFLSTHFSATVTGQKPDTRIRAFYPEIRLTVTSHAKTDSRLSFGHVAGPGT